MRSGDGYCSQLHQPENYLGLAGMTALYLYNYLCFLGPLAISWAIITLMVSDACDCKTLFSLPTECRTVWITTLNMPHPHVMPQLSRKRGNRQRNSEDPPLTSSYTPSHHASQPCDAFLLLLVSISTLHQPCLSTSSICICPYIFLTLHTYSDDGMTLPSDLKAISKHNVHVLRTSPLAELSGSLGDLGTLLPLMIAMTIQGSINLGSTLVFSGLANIITGLFFGVPLPVQPMKAIAAIAISQHFSKEEVAAAGLTMGIAVFVLSATGLLRWMHRVVPVPVVKGIQVGAGLSLVISAGSGLIKPLSWTSPVWDNRIWALAAFFLLVVASLLPRIPYALVVFAFGLTIAGTAIPGSDDTKHGFAAGIWNPSPFVPRGNAWRVGAIDAAIPQLPLTTLNSVLAVTSLSASLCPAFPPTPSTTAVGFSVAIFNLVGPWFGAMPICHGSGGLAGQYRFGARSGSSIIVLGVIKFVLGLFVGEAIIPLLQRFPKSLLGIMVLAAGVELAKVGQSVGESRDLWEQAEDDTEGSLPPGKSRQNTEDEVRDRWMVMLVTAAGCLAFKNDAIGFGAGLVWHWGLRSPRLLDRLRYGRGSIRLGNGDHEQGENLLRNNHDAPEG